MEPTFFNKYFKYIISAVLIAFLAVIAIAAYLYRQNLELKNPELAAKKETQEIVALVGRLMVLPEEETPTVATVTDPEKLKDQVFFANAKKGDKVLIYTQAKKAILYDPAQDKIIEVAPLNIGQ
jgi:hypothetical protein